MREAKPLAARPDAKVFARLKDAGKGIGDLDARRIVIADGYLPPDWTDRSNDVRACAVSPRTRYQLPRP